MEAVKRRANVGIRWKLVKLSELCVPGVLKKVFTYATHIASCANFVSVAAFFLCLDISPLRSVRRFHSRTVGGQRTADQPPNGGNRNSDNNNKKPAHNSTPQVPPDLRIVAI